MTFGVMRWIMSALAVLAPAASAPGATPAFGIYAYSPASWNNDVARQFPIVFVQYQSWERNPRKIKDIKVLAAAGSRVIIDFEFLKSTDQRVGREPPPAMKTILADADHVLKALDGVPLEGVTLEEENQPSAQRLALMGDLYVALKRAYPGRRFFQWISASTDVAGLRRLDLGRVPADGWVMDPYRLPISEYAAYVLEMRAVSDRLYSIIRAAPNWQIGGGYRKKVGVEWWNGKEWKVFYSRLAVNQAHDIPSIFYLFTLDTEQPTAPWLGTRCDRSFYTTLSTGLMPYMQRNKLSPRIPSKKPAWLPGYC